MIVPVVAIVAFEGLDCGTTGVLGSRGSVRVFCLGGSGGSVSPSDKGGPGTSRALLDVDAPFEREPCLSASGIEGLVALAVGIDDLVVAGNGMPQSQEMFEGASSLRLSLEAFARLSTSFARRRPYVISKSLVSARRHGQDLLETS